MYCWVFFADFSTFKKCCDFFQFLEVFAFETRCIHIPPNLCTFKKIQIKSSSREVIKPRNIFKKLTRMVDIHIIQNTESNSIPFYFLKRHELTFQFKNSHNRSSFICPNSMKISHNPHQRSCYEKSLHHFNIKQKGQIRSYKASNQVWARRCERALPKGVRKGIVVSVKIHMFRPFQKDVRPLPFHGIHEIIVTVQTFLLLCVDGNCNHCFIRHSRERTSATSSFCLFLKPKV